MARKQARRRKPAKKQSLKMPTIPVRRILTPIGAILVVVTTYHVSGNLLDRPIESIAVSGPFQRVTALQIEEAISDELDGGFLGADLAALGEHEESDPRDSECDPSERARVDVADQGVVIRLPNVDPVEDPDDDGHHEQQ